MEEWEGMCKAHNAIGYKNFITNKTKSISKQTISKQQYDATSVIAVLSARNTANAPPKKIQKRTLNTIAFPLKSVAPETLQKKLTPSAKSKPISISDSEEISEFSSDSDDIPLVDLC